jgi:hypothetical protein
MYNVGDQVLVKDLDGSFFGIIDEIRNEKCFDGQSREFVYVRTEVETDTFVIYVDSDAIVGVYN